MKIVEPGFEILRIDSEEEIINLLNLAARNCYKSEKEMTFEEKMDFLDKQILRTGHHSVIEHCNVTVRIICDRGISHEIVRHRIASYSQESTRYCNYSKGKHGAEITVIRPFFWEADCGNEAERNYREKQRMAWMEAMHNCEKAYLKLLGYGASPQEARSVLPNSLKTEIIMTANFRSWRNFFQQRTAKAAHPQMREIAKPMFEEFKRKIPLIFDDIVY